MIKVINIIFFLQSRPNYEIILEYEFIVIVLIVCEFHKSLGKK